jgi:hypothetical protein
VRTVGDVLVRLDRQRILAELGVAGLDSGDGRLCRGVGGLEGAEAGVAGSCGEPLEGGSAAAALNTAAAAEGGSSMCGSAGAPLRQLS